MARLADGCGGPAGRGAAVAAAASSAGAAGGASGPGRRCPQGCTRCAGGLSHVGGQHSPSEPTAAAVFVMMTVLHARH